MFDSDLTNTDFIPEVYLNHSLDFGFVIHDYTDNELPIIIKQGVYACTGWDTPPSMHGSFEIIRVTQGKINLVLNDKVYEINQDELAVVNYEDIHRLSKTDIPATYDVFLFQYQFCNEIGLDFANNRVIPVLREKTEHINYYCSAIIDEYNRKDIGHCSILKGLAHLLLLELIRNHSESKANCNPALSSPHYQIAKKTLRYIQSNYRRYFSINDISKALFISNSYLSHCFKKTIGVTPMEYANYLRCSIAFHCIATGHYPIKEAAYRCGFNNLSYFSRVFKKIIGILPSEVVIENN